MPDALKSGSYFSPTHSSSVWTQGLNRWLTVWLDASHTLKTALTLIVSEVLECKTDIEE